MMKTKKYIFLVIWTSLLAACGNQTIISDCKGQAAPYVDEYISLKGMYVWGEGVDAFTPCGQDKDYWVFSYSNVGEKLKSEYQNLTSEPYGSIYIEIIGVLGPRLHPIVGGEYQADYDGHVVIKNVSAIRKVSDVDCKP